MNIINKGDFIQSLPEDQYNAGLIKFNIPSGDSPTDLGGEGVWGWVSPDDKEKFEDDHFTGDISAILLNHPIQFGGVLCWGDEVKLKCHGDKRPTLHPDWVKFAANKS